MLNFFTISTGSTGNCYLLDDGASKLLIECGITFKEIQKALNFETSELCGCLVTHSHKDHSKGVKSLLERGIDVYMTKGESDALNINHHRLKNIEKKKPFKVGSFTFLAFDAMHDTADPVGFMIKSDNGKSCLFVTDSYYIKYKFPAVNIMAVEVNYDEQTIEENYKSGKLHKKLYERVVKSHMSLKTALEFFKSNDLSKVEEIHLLHLSDSNSNAERIYNEVVRATGKLVFIP